MSPHALNLHLTFSAVLALMIRFDTISVLDCYDSSLPYAAYLMPTPPETGLRMPNPSALNGNVGGLAGNFAFGEILYMATLIFPIHQWCHQRAWNGKYEKIQTGFLLHLIGTTETLLENFPTLPRIKKPIIDPTLHKASQIQSLISIWI